MLARRFGLLLSFRFTNSERILLLYPAFAPPFAL